MKGKRGFTLVEISLFIALSAALFLVVTLGVQNSIFQQRYNDSVQNFEEFLRTVYSGVTNVQNDATGGNSQRAIYGKLVTFGEELNLSGDKNDDHAIFVYNVVGNIDKNIGTGDTLSLLKSLNANVLIKDGETVSYAGMAESYNMKWSSVIQNQNDTNSFVGALLIVRHPKSGNISTFVMKGKTIEVNKTFSEDQNNIAKLLGNITTDFQLERADFCVNPYGDNDMSHRADVQISQGAKNSSAIKVFYDGDENECR